MLAARALSAPMPREACKPRKTHQAEAIVKISRCSPPADDAHARSSTVIAGRGPLALPVIGARGNLFTPGSMVK